MYHDDANRNYIGKHAHYVINCAKRPLCADAVIERVPVVVFFKNVNTFPRFIPRNLVFCFKQTSNSLDCFVQFDVIWNLIK